MNTVARAWQAAMLALAEARELHARGGDIETVRDLLRHARELIEIIEEEINPEREKFPDPDVVRMAAAELRQRVDAAAASWCLCIEMRGKGGRATRRGRPTASPDPVASVGEPGTQRIVDHRKPVSQQNVRIGPADSGKAGSVDAFMAPRPRSARWASSGVAG